MSNESLTIRAFRAVDEPATCVRYVQEHMQVLTDFGVRTAIKPDDGWTRDPSCHVIIAEHPTLGMVGGVKVLRTKAGVASPMEQAIGAMDPHVNEVMNALSSDGNAEVCGLWNAGRYGGRGVPLLLSLAAVSLGSQLGLNTMTCFVAHYTLRHALKAGFTLLEELGDGGTYSYPIPEIKSMAMVIPDILTLGTARPEYREKLISLRLRPEQVRMECPSGVVIEVCYKLLVIDRIIDLRVYRSILEERSRFAASA